MASYADTWEDVFEEPYPGRREPSPIPHTDQQDVLSSISSGSEQSYESCTSEGNSTIADLFRCFICMGQLRRPVLCPFCSKLCCHVCISQWLESSHGSQCPHCRAFLTEERLVNARFMDDLKKACLDHTQRASSEIVESSPSSASASAEEAPDPPPTASQELEWEPCKYHQQLSVRYYCQTCQEPLCSDCALCSPLHVGHQFQRLQDCYDRVKLDLLYLMRTVRGPIAKLERCMDRLRGWMETARCAKEDALSALMRRTAMEKQQLEDRFCEQTEPLVGKTTHVWVFGYRIRGYWVGYSGEVGQRLAALQAFTNDIAEVCRGSTPAQLVRQAKQLRLKEQELRDKETTLDLLEALQVDLAFEETGVMPPFRKETFVLPYWGNHEIPGTYYSKPLRIHGMEWRLKVFSRVVLGTAHSLHLSTSVEMFKVSSSPSVSSASNSHRQPGKYQFRVKLIHPGNPLFTICKQRSLTVRQYQGCEFHSFCHLDELKEYLVDNQLTFEFEVRATSYLQECLDLSLYVETLEEKCGRITSASELQDEVEVDEREEEGTVLEEAVTVAVAEGQNANEYQVDSYQSPSPVTLAEDDLPEEQPAESVTEVREHADGEQRAGEEPTPMGGQARLDSSTNAFDMPEEDDEDEEEEPFSSEEFHLRRIDSGSECEPLSLSELDDEENDEETTMRTCLEKFGALVQENRRLLDDLNAAIEDHPEETGVPSSGLTVRPTLPEPEREPCPSSLGSSSST